MENIVIGSLQVLFVILISPFIKTLIHKIKCILRGQKGPPIYQAYLDIYKLLKKEAVISSDASFISRISPYLVFVSTVWAATFLPVINSYTLLSFTGDIIALVYILAFGTFCLALYGMDQASAFGGLGSSREMVIASLAEPSFMLIIFAFALQTGTTNISNILEASGRHLALFELSSYIKLTIFLTVASNIFVPFGFYNQISIIYILLGVVLFTVKMILFAIPIAIIEISMAKMRFFRVPEILTLGFILAIISLIIYHI